MTHHDAAHELLTKHDVHAHGSSWSGIAVVKQAQLSVTLTDKHLSSWMLQSGAAQCLLCQTSCHRTDVYCPCSIEHKAMVVPQRLGASYQIVLAVSAARCLAAASPLVKPSCNFWPTRRLRCFGSSFSERLGLDIRLRLQGRYYQSLCKLRK